MPIDQAPYHAAPGRACDVPRVLHGHDAPAAHPGAWERRCVLEAGHRPADTADGHWCPCPGCAYLDPDDPRERGLIVHPPRPWGFWADR